MTRPTATLGLPAASRTANASPTGDLSAGLILSPPRAASRSFWRTLSAALATVETLSVADGHQGGARDARKEESGRFVGR
jgi:hypothetical protein